MAKQRLNHSRYLDTCGEKRRSALEEEHQHLFASLRAVEFAEQNCAMFEEDKEVMEENT